MAKADDLFWSVLRYLSDEGFDVRALVAHADNHSERLGYHPTLACGMAVALPYNDRGDLDKSIKLRDDINASLLAGGFVGFDLEWEAINEQFQINHRKFTIESTRKSHVQPQH